MIDILSDTETGDLLFINGDIVYGESTKQHQRDILLAQPGDYKNAPDATIGISQYVNDDDPDAMLEDIRVKFRKDGMDVQELNYKNGILKITAPYAS